MQSLYAQGTTNAMAQAICHFHKSRHPLGQLLVMLLTPEFAELQQEHPQLLGVFSKILFAA